ncbi:L-dopachrome tautomerase-related protein [Ohtaekwangia sp.]|uniref:L-dopachrome tautomerase-related protein n=1 Tax=Ohtaekwangia sp. TaxID=2066019 RepID=UPI002F93E720
MINERGLVRVIAWLIMVLPWMACHEELNTGGTEGSNPGGTNAQVTVVANSLKQWTGVAISHQSRTDKARLFANYPNWSPDHQTSVVDITDPAKATPYPDENWNTWSPGMKPEEHFICVQSVYIDRNDYLWVLDAANPRRNGTYTGVVKGGAKVVQFDLKTNRTVNVIVIDEPAITTNSYLNDIRIDEQRQIAYITDSNEGAIVVVDLDTGKSWRMLANNPATKSEDLVLTIDGKEYLTQNGEHPEVHSDGIALSPDGLYLYWRPLTGESLYRIATTLLIYPDFYPGKLDESVEHLGEFPPSDGMIFGQDGKLYLASVEESAIRVYDGNTTHIVVQDSNFRWPDSFAVGPDGSLYVSSSQLNDLHPEQPYRILKFKP